MKEAGCRLLIVGYESGDEQILRNIKKGATIDMAKRFTENCHKLGLVIHGDFIVGLPGETRETLRNTIDFAKKLDVETIQVSIAHAFPGTEFYDYAKKNNLVQHQHGGRRRPSACPTSSIPEFSKKTNWWSGWSASTANIISVRRPPGASFARRFSTITSAAGSTRKPRRYLSPARTSARSTSPSRRPGGWPKNART